MSVAIHWRPLGDQGKIFRGGTSTSLEILKRTFGNELIENAIPVLRGMAELDKFYDEVADIVETVGAIKVWGVY